MLPALLKNTTFLLTARERGVLDRPATLDVRLETLDMRLAFKLLGGLGRCVGRFSERGRAGAQGAEHGAQEVGIEHLSGFIFIYHIKISTEDWISKEWHFNFKPE